jgi:hypothetical protein
MGWSIKNLHLIEIKEKGKSQAIRIFKNSVLEWNNRSLKDDKRIEKLLLIDADAFLGTDEVVYQMAETLNDRSDLAAILPFGMPNIEKGITTGLISRLYEAKIAMALRLKGTGFTGGCYMIRSEVAQLIEIPDYIMAEDFYISERLRKGYMRDYNITYYYSIPATFRSEVNKIFRHSLANVQMRSFFGRGLFKQPVVDGTAPLQRSLYEKGGLRKEWSSLNWHYKLLMLVFLFVGKIGDIRARFLIRKYGAKNIKFIMEQWKTVR